MPGRVVVVGEAIIDLVGAADGRYAARPGGSPANVAIGLARPDVPVSLCTRLGADALGRLHERHLGEQGVALLGPPPQGPSTLAVASVAPDGGATYDFWLTPTVDAPWPELPDRLPADAIALHAGSIAAWQEPSATDVTALLSRVRGDVVVSLDPNCRPLLADGPDQCRVRVERQVDLAHLVKVSAEDVAWLCPASTVEEVAAAWLARGPSLVVVTLGERGAYAVSSAGAVTVSAPVVTVADTVGAGDSFTAALLAALRSADALTPTALAGADPDLMRSVLTRACAAAAFTCTRTGADPPTRADLDEQVS